MPLIADGAQFDNDLVDVAGGTQADDDANDFYETTFDISRDGRYVVFASEATNLDPADTDSRQDIFIRDMSTGEVDLVSRATGAAGAAGDSASYWPSLSADGRYVAFYSAASNLATGAAGEIQNVFVRDTVADTTELISREDGVGTPDGSSNSWNPAISADGNRVAFQTNANNLSDDDVDTETNVLVRDRTTNLNLLVSRADGPAGLGANDASEVESHGISEDGSMVVFSSRADNLHPDDLDTGSDVFVRDLSADTTELVSRASGAAGDKGDSDSSGAAIADDASKVAFESNSANLDPAVISSADIHLYSRDLGTDATELVGRETGVAGAPIDDYSVYADVSAEGRYITFVSGLADVSPAAAWVRDTVDATTSLLSQANGSGGPSVGTSGVPAISSDGAYGVFSTDGSGVSADTIVNPALVHVYRRQLAAVVAEPPETTITSGPADGATITTNSTSFGFSSSAVPSTFECEVDAGSFAACTSPRLLSGLAEGSHTFSVRAIDGDLMVDPTPAERTFSVDLVDPPVELPPPVQGGAVNVIPISGEVLVKLPGTDTFIPFEEAQQLPVGTIFDLRDGRIRLISSAKGDKTRSALFYGGVVKVLQAKKDGAYTVVKLVGKLEGCGKKKGREVAARRGKKGGRGAWGKGGGGHRSQGGKSSGTVRGTWWLVEDLCNGKTRTFVKEGKVTVRDFKRKRTVKLKKGESYLAPGPKKIKK